MDTDKYVNVKVEGLEITANVLLMTGPDPDDLASGKTVELPFLRLANSAGEPRWYLCTGKTGLEYLGSDVEKAELERSFALWKAKQKP